MKQEREVHGEGQAFFTPPTEPGRPTTSSVGDGLCEGSVCRMPWKWHLPLGSQHGARELCLPRHSLGHTVVAFLPPWHVESGQAPMQNKWLLWDSIPERPSGTSSLPSSSSWDSLHCSGDLCQWTRWHCTITHGPDGRLLSSFYEHSFGAGHCRKDVRKRRTRACAHMLTAGETRQVMPKRQR